MSGPLYFFYTELLVNRQRPVTDPPARNPAHTLPHLRLYPYRFRKRVSGIGFNLTAIPPLAHQHV
jgi:hypothetical protein